MPASPDPAARAALHRAALEELERAGEGAADYRALLTAGPDALFRDGGPRHVTASAVVIDAPAEHVALVWHRKGRAPRGRRGDRAHRPRAGRPRPGRAAPP